MNAALSYFKALNNDVEAPNQEFCKAVKGLWICTDYISLYALGLLMSLKSIYTLYSYTYIAQKT